MADYEKAAAAFKDGCETLLRELRAFCPDDLKQPLDNFLGAGQTSDVSLAEALEKLGKRRPLNVEVARAAFEAARWAMSALQAGLNEGGSLSMLGFAQESFGRMAGLSHLIQQALDARMVRAWKIVGPIQNVMRRAFNQWQRGSVSYASDADFALQLCDQLDKNRKHVKDRTVIKWCGAWRKEDREARKREQEAKKRGQEAKKASP